MNIVIPLCGIGKRFKGYDKPKPLIEVFEKPILSYVLDSLKGCNIYIIYNNLELDNFLDKYHVNKIFLETKTRGALETIKLGLEKIDKRLQNIMVIDCDTYYTENFISMYKGGNVIFYRDEPTNSSLYSYIILDGENVIEIKEKEKISDNANTGIYCFSDSEEFIKYASLVINDNFKFKNEYYTSCVIKYMLNNGINFNAIKLNHVFNLGTPEQVNCYLNRSNLYLFDLDGTMVITDNIYLDVWNSIFKKYNIIINDILFSEYIRGKSDDDVTKFFLGNSIDVSNIKDELFISMIDRVKIIPGIIEYLNKIKLNGHKIAIVTNCNRKACNKIIEYCHFDRYVDFVVTSSECIKTKPNPEPYLKAVQYFNSDNNKAIIFEDSKSGIISGKSIYPKYIVGVKTNHDEHFLSSLGVNKVISDYCEMELIEDNHNFLISLKRYLTNCYQFKIDSISFEDNKLKGGFISDIVKLRINNENFILKLENNNNSNMSRMANLLELYDREYYFYEIISKYIPVKIPKFHSIIFNDEGIKIGILMEDISLDNFDINLNLNTESINVSLKVIDRIANLHSHFWNKKIDVMFPKLRNFSNINCVNFIKENFPHFIKKWEYILSDEIKSKLEKYCDTFEEISSYLHSGNNLTLCHGDIKSPNIFYRKDDKEPLFIDWQYITCGKGVKDLIFFMIESFDNDTIKYNRNIFKDYYYIKLKENGIIYDINDYNRDFELSIGYFPFFVCVWFGTICEDELIDKNFPQIFIRKYISFISDT